MSKKPKFLYRPAEYAEWFASLGRKLKFLKKAGIADWGVKDRYLKQRDLLLERNVEIRHRKWKQVYDAAHEKGYAQAMNALGKNEAQASKYARQKGEQAVVEAFPDEVKSMRTVRNAMNRLNIDGE